MKRETHFPQWKGFEKAPQGCLLEQVVDLSPAMGFAYERSCEYYKDFHTHERLMLVCPRGSSVMEVRTQAPKETHRIDSSSILLVPKYLEHDDEGVSCIYDTMALYPTDELVFSVAEGIGISKSQLVTLAKKCTKVRRTRKLQQLTQEYFTERVVANSTDRALTLEYLGVKILFEVLSSLFPNSKKMSLMEPPSQGEESVVLRALQYVESNLFAPLELEQIAKHAGASVSTLTRRFKKEIKQTPYSYLRNRRLEEAYCLLSNGAHSVGEVALLVGYDNFGAFTDAFKSKYGNPPSCYVSGL